MTIYLDPLLLAASSNLPEFRLEKATQALRKVRNSAWSCTGWGLPCRSCHQKRGELLPRLFTLTSCEAVCFLLRYPSYFYAWTLSSILPCGARTFLPRFHESGHPSSQFKCSIIFYPFKYEKSVTYHWNCCRGSAPVGDCGLLRCA